MNDQEHPSGEANAVQEELVAYLDGELDPQAAARVEDRLANDAEYRRRLSELDQAWDLLDYLPPTQVEESFARSTVAMVALAAEKDVLGLKTRSSQRRTLTRVLGGCAVAVALAAGYLLTGYVASQPNRQLVRDLPVIENVDLYHHVDSVDFLRELDEQGLFAEEVEDAI